MVSEAFLVCLCAGTRVAGLWQGPMEAITIQIITSVIKETLGEDSSELILPQSRQGSGEKRASDKLCFPCCIFFSWPEDSGDRTAWKNPSCRWLCSQPGLSLGSAWLQDEADWLPLLTQGEAGSQPLTAAVTRHARVSSHNGFADTQQLAWRPQLTAAHFYWPGVHVPSWCLAVELDLGCL